MTSFCAYLSSAIFILSLPCCFKVSSLLPFLLKLLGWDTCLYLILDIILYDTCALWMYMIDIWYSTIYLIYTRITTWDMFVIYLRSIFIWAYCRCLLNSNKGITKMIPWYIYTYDDDKLEQGDHGDDRVIFYIRLNSNKAITGMIAWYVYLFENRKYTRTRWSRGWSHDTYLYTWNGKGMPMKWIYII